MKINNYSEYEIYPNEGKIWSYKSNKFIGANRNGYLIVSLYADDGSIWKTGVHRVIYTACYGEIPEGYEVNHIDENKENNCIDNLNLLTHTENVNWGTRTKRASLKNKTSMRISEKAKIARVKVGLMRKGTTLSEETKCKISKSKKGKPNWKLQGKTFSNEHKQKLSEAKKGKLNTHRSKQVGMYKDDVLIQIFPSTAEAQRQLGFNSHNIMACCSGKRNVCGGYQWQYIKNNGE